MSENIYAFLQPALTQGGETPAWICRMRDGRRIVAYQALHRATLTVADMLRARGVQPGDSIGIIAANGPEFTVAALATWKLGANIAPVHIGNSEQDIAAQLDALQPRALLHHEAKVADGVAIDMQPDSDAVQREAAVEPPSDATANLAARIYTSGSTGTPKVVRLSHANFISNVRAANRIETFAARDRFLSLLPFSHAMGLLGNMLLPLYHGAAIVTPKQLAAAEILATLTEENISVVIAVPRLYRNVMHGLEKKFKAGGAPLAAYRALLKAMPPALRQKLNAPIRNKLGGQITAWVSGGSHLDGRISRYYHDLGLPLRQGYGLTETSPLACMQTAFDAAAESVGKAVEKVEIRIDAPDESGSGEVWIRGPNVMLGYEDEAQNAAAMQDGWFKTGDLGRLDAAGRLFLTGRKKRLIVSEAGKNIYPEELETLLERDATVKEAGVFELEMRPACVLSMNLSGDDSASDAATAARAALAKFNQTASAHNRITRFAVVDELPRTPLGKMALQELPGMFARFEVK